MATLLYYGDDLSLYGREFTILKTFKYSYNIDADGVIYRVSINDVKLKEENNGRNRTMDQRR